MNKVWFITGASGGIGQAIVDTALRHGDFVAAATRSGILKTQQNSKNLRVLKLDISEQNQNIFDNAVASAADRFGRIDFLVNNAGHGRITNFEETSKQSIKALYEVNVFGAMRMTRAVLPIMRKQRQGHIFNISSGAGYCGGPTAYHTSKFAITGFSCSLAFELAPFGIKVTNVAPGMFRTSFYDDDKIKTDYDIYIPDYDGCRWQTQFMQENSKHNQVGDPAKLGELLYEVAYSENPPLHLPVGADAIAVLENLQAKLHEDVSAWKDKANKMDY